MGNELNHETMIKLCTPQMSMFDINNKDDEEEEKEKEEDDDDDDDSSNMLALCSCFDFNPFMEHLYLVGTEDGHILECSKTYNDGPTKIFANAHFMNVYGIKWNPYHSKIFLSCSEDWTLKLWEMGNEQSEHRQTTKGDADDKKADN